jgi:3-hydroxyacyl-[acyl-carrier-protein] dehydratase
MRFFLVDRIDELQPGILIRGVKNVTLSEDFIQDHFPGIPVYPGALLVESLAQLAGVLVEAGFKQRHPEANPHRAVLAQIQNAKFFSPSRPGDQLLLECRLKSEHDEAAMIDGEVKVGQRLIGTAQLIFTLIEVKNKNLNEQRDRLYKIWTEELNEIRQG